jgi:fibronectin type 3 domain-containing protein
VTSVTPVVWQDLGPITGNTFSDTTAQAGFVYAYAASATSAELDAESIRGVVNQGYPAVGPPTGVTATTNLPQYVRLNWVSPVASGAPVSYQVFRRKGNSGRFIQIGTTTSLAYFDVTAVPNTNYQYQVRVRLSNGVVSANSSTVTGRRIVVPSAP